MLTEETRKKMLEYPPKPVKIVLDTDTKNEIDDQFAIVYALLSQKDVEIEAFTAAPFARSEVVSQRLGIKRFANAEEYPDAAAGMEASYKEILLVLEKMGVKNKVPVFRGSKTEMTSPDKPVKSDAATQIVQLAMKERKNPLYVVAIGAITNVISAIVMKPEIKEKIVVLWLGGHPTYWDHSREFNLANDPVGAAALYDSGVPLIWVPCKNVAEHNRTVQAEMEQYVRGRGAIGDYLADLVKTWEKGEARSKVLWDIVTIAYLVNKDSIPTKLSPAPKLNLKDLTWDKTPSGRHMCLTAIDVKRDPIFLDFFQKLEKFSKGKIVI